MTSVGTSRKLYLASGNAGKLREFRALAATAHSNLELELLPHLTALPEFPETAPTFAENAAGKALYYSRTCGDMVFSDDSGLVVPALGGEPGVHSARYAGLGASNDQKIAKLLAALRGKMGAERSAYFVCVIAVAQLARVMAVVSEKVDGEIAEAPRGNGGFGYDPVFYVPALGKTFAELSAEEKNARSHRGKAFRRLMEVLES
ncbi:MAG TPA: RdgB/HAM1 family non-canonical purine NTP pyrophosphatase [Verrucomicrobiae bacterium]|nr:RdgB/HAM1 family non-canonical purine NTP pyrophosphatase [Verrucomicrobiae bacterium]